MRSRLLSTLLLLLALGSVREAAAQACLSTQGSQEYCNALTAGVRFGFPRYTTAALPTCNTSNKGAVAFDTTAGSYKGCDGSTWAAIGFSGGAITSPILAPTADNCATPPYSFSGDTNTGVCSSAADTVGLRAGGATAFYCNTTACVLGGSSAALLFGEATSAYPMLHRNATQLQVLLGDSSGYAPIQVQYVITTSTGLNYHSGALTASSRLELGGNLDAPETFLYSDSANVLAQRNSTNAQTFNWYHTYTDASNYHRGALKTSSTGIEIAAETAGSGSDNLDITLSPTGTGQVKVASSYGIVVDATTYITGTNVYTPTLTVATSSSPASGAACTTGTITWDASYIYVCTASGAWKRAALTGGY